MQRLAAVSTTRRQNAGEAPPPGSDEPGLQRAGAHQVGRSVGVRVFTRLFLGKAVISRKAVRTCKSVASSFGKLQQLKVMAQR